MTFQVLGLLSGSFAAFMLIIIAFYAGELVWRERDNRLDQISDALPTPTWLPLVSKLGALMLVPAVLQAVLMLCGMAIQAAKGYTRFEPGLYLFDLFTIDLVNYWMVCALAIAVHAHRRQQVRRPLRRGRVLRAAAVRAASSAWSTTSTSSATCRRPSTPT